MSVTKGRNVDKEAHHKPASQKGEWCVERAVSTPSSCVDKVCAKGLEVEVPPSGEGTLSSEEAPSTTPHEDNTPEAPQVPVEEDPQGGGEPIRTYADIARTPPSPAPGKSSITASHRRRDRRRKHTKAVR